MHRLTCSSAPCALGLGSTINIQMMHVRFHPQRPDQPACWVLRRCCHLLCAPLQLPARLPARLLACVCERRRDCAPVLTCQPVSLLSTVLACSTRPCSRLPRGASTSQAGLPGLQAGTGVGCARVQASRAAGRRLPHPGAQAVGQGTCSGRPAQPALQVFRPPRLHYRHAIASMRILPPAHGCVCTQNQVLNPAFDAEARDFVAGQYRNAGVKLALETTPTKIEKGGDGKLTVTCEPKDGEAYTIGDLDLVMMATGRAPATKNIGLEEVRAGHQ